MSYTNLTFDVRDRIATITINRPDKLNALNDATIAELDTAIGEVIARKDVGGAIVTGSGAKAFVAGADIGELATQGSLDGRLRAMVGQRIFSKFEQSPKPVIAAINGFALGGGLELALACHIRIASENAKMGLPEVKLGIGPGYGGTQRLPRLIGKGRALELMLTGVPVDAAEAHRIGLVNKVVPQAELIGAAEAMMKLMLANGPIALGFVIEAVNRGLDTTLEEGLVVEANHFGLIATTADMKEGMSAFLEKRPAAFKGA
jgi:enoyl-CoA hydratase